MEAGVFNSELTQSRNGHLYRDRLRQYLVATIRNIINSSCSPEWLEQSNVGHGAKLLTQLITTITAAKALAERIWRGRYEKTHLLSCLLTKFRKVVSSRLFQLQTSCLRFVQTLTGVEFTTLTCQLWNFPRISRATGANMCKVSLGRVFALRCHKLCFWDKFLVKAFKQTATD